MNDSTEPGCRACSWIDTPGSSAEITQDKHDWHLVGKTLVLNLSRALVTHPVQHIKLAVISKAYPHPSRGPAWSLNTTARSLTPTGAPHARQLLLESLICSCLSQTPQLQLPCTLPICAAMCTAINEQSRLNKHICLQDPL